MKRLSLLLTALALLLTALPASASQKFPMVGDPLPDFTFIDTEGTEITLSELLKDNELVVICMFTSWCGPCKTEFPYMQKVYEQYGDRMEMLALTMESRDTMETMAKYKAERDLGFHFGLARDTNIRETVPVHAYPTNIFVDRFGNIGLVREGIFPGVDAFERAVKTFLGDDYTRTVTLEDIPDHIMDVPYPDEAELAAALTGEGISLTCAVDRADGIYPFVPETLGDRTAVFASNAGLDCTTAHMTATFASHEGDALYFEVGADMSASSQPLEFRLDGETVKYFANKRDWTPFVMPLTPGTHKAEFVYSPFLGDESIKYIGIDNMRLFSGDKAAEMLSRVREYPVSDETSITLLDESARKAVLIWNDVPMDRTIYISNADTIRVAIRVTEDYDPEVAVATDDLTNNQSYLADLPVEDNAYIYECPSDGATAICLYDNPFLENPKTESIIVCHGEAGIEGQIEMNRAIGNEGMTWRYADAMSEDATYTVTVVDQNGDPVPEVSLTFCLDDACRLAEGDENGVVVFEGAPAEYHVQVVDAPDGYSYSGDSDIYTEARTSEATITITKDGLAR